MFLPDYRPDEVRFAYCYHVYVRWHTWRRRPLPPLARLDLATLRALGSRFDIHLLECEGQPTGLRVLISLKPQDTTSASVSKLKGQTSKWLREALGQPRLQPVLGRGYFASTTGKSTAQQVSDYLAEQGAHHGYAQRSLPPIHVQSYALTPEVEARLQAAHACAVLRFHLVLATWRRRGVFGPEEARAAAEGWRALQLAERFGLLKVSFVPDHVHVAVQTHPGVAPARLALVLMNAAQEVLVERFGDSLIQARVERLWQPGAYVGSFGDLATPQMQQYLRNWADRLGGEG